jgi:hypothetical protein|tara:strand:- start:1303 stop:1539 length:237 start_codon:yes stop_codon:yes gene_type:complete
LKSKAKQLSEKLGGIWTYDGMSSWWCDDNQRHVSKVHTGGFDINGEAMPGYGYFLYGDGAPKRVYFSGVTIKSLLGVF